MIEEHIKQDKPTNCGQTCVAMLLGLTIQQSERLFGKKGCTTTKEVKKALEIFGCKVADKLKRCNNWTAKFPPLCIIKMSFLDSGRSHWVVFSETCIYDPAMDHLVSYSDFKLLTEHLIKPTSYLQLSQFHV